MQSQVAPGQSIDAIINGEVNYCDAVPTNGHTCTDATKQNESEESFLPRWLTQDSCTVKSGRRGGLEVALSDGQVFRGVFAVNLFPATNPNDYISLRVWNRDGSEQEVGILRQLDHWPQDAQTLVREALSRRYYLQTITGIDQIRLEMGHLSITARTDHGPRRFTMRWSQSHVQDFGERGKVLLDLDDNRYLVPDVEALPPRERDLFQRYVYW
jgi:hypothetical protein